MAARGIVLDWPLVPAGPVITPGVDPLRYMFFATRARQPSGTMTAAADGTQVKTSLFHFWNSVYKQDGFRFHFSGFGLNETGAAAVESLAPGNAMTIHKAFLVYGGQKYPITFGGALSVVIASGSLGAWSDDIPLPGGLAADAKFAIATIYSTAVGENQLPVMRASRHLGDRIWGAAAAAEAEAFLDNAAQPSTVALDPDASRGSNGQPAYYGPDMMVARGGWDGRPVALVTNDSIGDSRNEYSCSLDARGNSGWLRRWLDDPAGLIGRVPHFNMGVPGQQALNELLAASSSTKRWDVLDQLIALNGGKRPFTFCYQQMGQNDTTTQPTYLTRIQGLVQRLRDRYAGIKVVQSIPMGRTTSTDRYLTTANQTFEGSNIYPTATKWQLRDAILANTGAWHDGYIDTFAAWSDATALGKWPQPPGDVLARLSAGISGTSYSFVTDGPMPEGQYVSLGTLTGLTVGYSTSNGDGTWTNSIANGSTATVPAGTPAYLTPTNDGVHPSKWAAIRQASLMPAGDKAKFVF